MFKFKKGFTLVELLVVIAIIGLLAGVVMVSLNTARRKARDAVRKADIANLAIAIEQYYDDQATPAYPADLTVLTTYVEGGIVPTDPSSGGAYTYTVDVNGNYKVCATIEKDASIFCKGPGA